VFNLHAIMAYGGNELQLHKFITSTTLEVNVTFRLLCSGVETPPPPGIHWTRGWLGNETFLDVMKKEKSCRNCKPSRPNINHHQQIKKRL